MLKNSDMVKVTNRSRGSLGYQIPDLNNLRRKFTAGETKEVTVEEIRKLSYIDGGRALLSQYLVLDSKELIAELNGETPEPEYFYDAAKIEDMLRNATLDEFLDMLDFAPEGVKELIQRKAVEIKVDSAAKREAILEKTGFNVTKAIEIANELAKPAEKVEAPTPATRRVSPTKTAEEKEAPKTTRRVKLEV